MCFCVVVCLFWFLAGISIAIASVKWMEDEEEGKRRRTEGEEEEGD